jgi:hypothetical protein
MVPTWLRETPGWVTVPDLDERRSDRHTGPAELWVRGQRWQAPATGVGSWTLAPVEYCPYITYRGRILWHHHSDAMDVAQVVAYRRGVRHTVRPVRVRGHDHLMWWVASTRGRMVFAKGNDPEWVED